MPARPPLWRRLSPARCPSGISIAFTAAVFMLGLGPAGALAGGTAAELGPGIVSSKSRIVSQVGPYDDKRRWQIYTALNKEYLKLWDRGAGKVLITRRTRTFPRFPYLQIEDRNRDGSGDFYAYYAKQSGGQTQEFGAFFDLADDGTPDWLVFYGGNWIGEGGGFNIVYWNHHVIDRNNDGRFDTLVLDCVDRDGNGRIEPGRTAWLYDTNFDGKFDSAQHIDKGKTTKIPVANGRFETGIPLTAYKNLKVGSPFGKLFDNIAKDIAAAR